MTPKFMRPANTLQALRSGLKALAPKIGSGNWKGTAFSILSGPWPRNPKPQEKTWPLSGYRIFQKKILFRQKSKLVFCWPFKTRQAEPPTATLVAFPTWGIRRRRGTPTWIALLTDASCLYSELPQPNTSPLSEFLFFQTSIWSVITTDHWRPSNNRPNWQYRQFFRFSNHHRFLWVASEL